MSMPNRSGAALVIAAALMGLACGSTASPLTARPAPPERTEQFISDAKAESTPCPMEVEDADVVLSFVSGGGALIFTTATEQASLIQAAARRFASHYDTEAPPKERTEAGQAPEVHWNPLGIASRAEYSNVTAGARVEVKAINPREVNSLQRRLRQEAARMQRTKQCRLNRTDAASS